MCYVVQDQRAGQGAKPEDEDGPLQRGGGRAEGGQTGDEQADPGSGGRRRRADGQNQGGWDGQSDILKARIESLQGKRLVEAHCRPVCSDSRIQTRSLVSKIGYPAF